MSGLCFFLPWCFAVSVWLPGVLGSRASGAGLFLLCWHAGHVSESLFLVQCKYLANGVWLVLNCIRILASFLGKGVMSLMNFSKQADGSVFFIHAYQGDFVHSFCALLFNFSLYACLIADLLRGSFLCKIFGSLSMLLPPSVIAFFASLSAFSFPSTPVVVW